MRHLVPRSIGAAFLERARAARSPARGGRPARGATPSSSPPTPPAPTLGSHLSHRSSVRPTTPRPPTGAIRPELGLHRHRRRRRSMGRRSTPRMRAGVTPTRRHVLASPTALVALGAVIVVGALAAIAGVRVARIAAPAEPEHLPVRVVSVGPARLVVPADWQPASLTSGGIGGLDAAHAVALNPAPGLNAGRHVRSRRGAVASSRQTCGRRSPGLCRCPNARGSAGRRRGATAISPSRSGRRADVTVLATTSGVLAVACTTPAGSTADPRCASGVESVTVPGAATLAPSQSLALELRLPTVLDRLTVRDPPIAPRCAVPGPPSHRRSGHAVSPPTTGPPRTHCASLAGRRLRR